MKNYELVVIFHPELEGDIEPAVAKVKNLVTENGGKITKEDAEGKKRLAYPVKGQNFGIYYYYEVELPAQAPAKMSRVLNIADDVMRYLLVTQDERKLKYEAKQAARQPHKEDNEEVKK